jgi:hypothetical protein
LLNANLLFYKGLASLNQHIAYDFEFLIKPENYPEEWKLIISLLLDFLNFKDEMVPLHHKLNDDLESAYSQL